MAFYIGSSAHRFYFFDERTWQADIAPARKTSALAALGQDSVRTVFGRYESVNADLQGYLRIAWEGKLSSSHEQTGGGDSMPCVFNVINHGVLKPPAGARTNEIARQLFDAELALQSDPANQAQALEQIQKVLETTVSNEQDAPWSAVYYTSLAVKSHLRQGDAQAAKRVLLRGLQLKPNSIILKYLQRILVREGILQPSDMPIHDPKLLKPVAQSPEPRGREDVFEAGNASFDATLAGTVEG
jgi:tetratricopeptide (TPR) repeat protein